MFKILETPLINYMIYVGTNLRKNSVKLGNGVIIGPLWVKYGGKIACQPPSAQNSGNDPDIYKGNCKFWCQKVLDIKIHNSVTNRVRHLWYFAF